jgi:hypothetical protein
MAGSRVCRLLLSLLVLAISIPLVAQQSSGGISGRVTAVDGSALPGVTVEARSNVLPQPRVTTTQENGNYRLPSLPPGTYTVTFTLAGMDTRTRTVQVFLGQDQNVNVALGVAGIAESITVTADTPLIDPTSTEVKTALDSVQIQELPTGQDYRHLMALIPGVQYSENVIRGPSAGGSGQDNMYHFDGVNVTLPLFGTLSAEPSTHDVQQVSVIKGGAKAIDFNRSAGFTIDTVSKSGTSQFMGQIGYEFQNKSLVGDVTGESVARDDTTRSWLDMNIGGPLLRDRLFFFASYYRPEVDRENRSNAYGEVPDFKSTRNEYFGKLTFTPLANVLLNASYRDSDRKGRGENVGTFATPTLARSSEASQRIGILEGSWILSANSHATFKFNNFTLETADRPDFLASFSPSLAPGTRFDVANLDRMGSVSIPTPLANNPSFNAFLAPIIDRYGFLENGVRTGGGAVGFSSTIEEIDFYRENWQGGYNFTMGTNIAHDLHVGYQQYTDREVFQRVSNGWGGITLTGGRSNCPAAAACAGQPVFYTARFIRGTLGEFPLRDIDSRLRVQNIEFNDTIRWNNWAFNAGVILSQDTYYGQGLRNDSSTLSGFTLAPGNRYKMYEIEFKDQIQPRLGATWTYNNEDNVYVSYSRSNPPASSLPRAASWDRNNIGLFYDAFFDADGNLMGFAEVGSSSGKLFADGLKPRYVDEYLIGTAQQINNRWTARVYGRHRYSARFWEDTNNNARVIFDPPPGIPRVDYIPDLTAKRQQICQSNREACGGPNATVSGSTYVIAQLDDAFTKYYEATAESDWRGGNAFVRGSYTWSQYYGNFDQDNTTGADNDLSLFIGSSNLGDGAGRQLWDNKYGWLRGDRRHMVKILSTYAVPWNATIGAVTIFQSGEPWQAESYLPYAHLTTSTVSSNRYAEPAGSRRTPDHYRLDLKYTQNLPFGGNNVQLELDMFNVTDNQTGYNYQPSLHSAGFDSPRSFYQPRRYEIAVRYSF